MRPRYKLSVVINLIEKGHYRIGHKRALQKVIKYLVMTTHEAEEFILKEVKDLTLENFSHQKIQNGEIYDVYGKRVKEIPWYIKFSICKESRGDFLWQISFHPTEYELKTKSEVLEKYEEDLS